MTVRAVVFLVSVTWMLQSCGCLSLPPMPEGSPAGGDASAAAAGEPTTSCHHVTSLMTSLKLAAPGKRKKNQNHHIRSISINSNAFRLIVINWDLIGQLNR